MRELNSVLQDVVGDGTLLTVQPGGNHGDSLIYHGFEKYIDETGIDRTELDSGRFRFDAPRGFSLTDARRNARWSYQQWKYARHRLFGDVSAVYIHGGGNFNDLWQVGIDCFLTIARFFDCPIVVGPQSCQFEETDPTALFESISNDIHFFCREEYSYDIIWRATMQCDHVDVYTDDDTALYIESDDLPAHTNTSEYTLLALRMDKDSTDPVIETDIDAPVKVSDISKMDDTYQQWVRTAARAERIYTDRLHVAILGWILDKPVTWYDTESHKNRGVYEYSLSDEPNIDFQYPTDEQRTPAEI